MQYLAGGSLKDRIPTGPRGELEPMPLSSLRDWLPDIARALDFIHSQNHIHRDVKPANILFDRHGNAFLGDFGIIKALTADVTDWQGNSLTAPGFLVGTPNYVAPEIVMGRPADGRVDQYSLAMTVYEVLTGNNCMEGPTPSATVVNQTMVVPPPLTEILPELLEAHSDAILRGLAKNPADRFETCSALAQEVLREVPRRSCDAPRSPPLNGLTSGANRAGFLARRAGHRCRRAESTRAAGLRCTRCQAVSYLQILSKNTLQLKLVEHPPVSVGAESPIVIDAPDDEVGTRSVGGHAPGAETRRELDALAPAGQGERTGQRPPSGRAGWTRRALAVLAIAGGLRRGSLHAQQWRAFQPGGAPRLTGRGASRPATAARRPVPAACRDPHRLRNREAEVAGAGNRRIREDTRRPEDQGQPARHGLGGGGPGGSRRPEPRSDPRLVAGQQCLPRPLRAGMAGQAREQPDPQGREPGSDADGLRHVAGPSRGVHQEVRQGQLPDDRPGHARARGLGDDCRPA